MGKKLEGKLGWSGRKIALVIGRFNSFVSAKLKDGAIDCLSRHGVSEADIEEIWVPGAYEIPFVAKTVAATVRPVRRGFRQTLRQASRSSRGTGVLNPCGSGCAC